MAASSVADVVFTLVRAAGDLATHCDRVEHNEESSANTLRESGQLLRGLAAATSRDCDLDLLALYGARIERIERKHPGWSEASFDGGQFVRQSKSWADVQYAQYQHDNFYHADVAGLAKFDQLRHYTLHVAKLAKLALNSSDDLRCSTNSGEWESFLVERLPDIAIFGVKLATVGGVRLPSDGFE